MIYMIKLKTNFLIVVILLNLLLLPGCKNPEVERKIDANLKAELVRLKETSNWDQQVTVVFKTNEELTVIHHDVLQQKGVTIEASIGNIYTASMPAKSVYSLARQKFIDYVQGQKTFQIHPVDSTSK